MKWLLAPESFRVGLPTALIKSETLLQSLHSLAPPPTDSDALPVTCLLFAFDPLCCP